MDLFDILLVRKLVDKIGSGEITSPEAQEILKQLEEKASKDEVKIYVDSSIANIPTLNNDDLLDILK